jgi:uncharacterized protein YacL
MKRLINVLTEIFMRYICSGIKSLPINNPYFTFNMYNTGNNSLYILSERVNEELCNFEDNYIKWLYHICNSKADTGNYMSSAISGIFVPLMVAYMMVLITDKSGYVVGTVIMSIILLILYFTYHITKSQMQSSYYKFYLDKFKNEAEKRGLNL